MIEREFELRTHPEIKKYELTNCYNENVVIVTMPDIEEAFKEDPVELLRIKNNKSATWFISEIM